MVYFRDSWVMRVRYPHSEANLSKPLIFILRKYDCYKSTCVVKKSDKMMAKKSSFAHKKRKLETKALSVFLFCLFFSPTEARSQMTSSLSTMIKSKVTGEWDRFDLKPSCASSAWTGQLTPFLLICKIVIMIPS